MVPSNVFIIVAGIAESSTTTDTCETDQGGVPVERPTDENGCTQEDASNCMSGQVSGKF